jgi:hypothetical protein
MLCQLVCVDRRYQRMNCFNIRELQGMLKRKYFTDLVNSNDHRELLNSTMVGFRYKTNMTSSIDPNIISFYNFGTTFFNKSKADDLVSIYSGGDLLYKYRGVYYAVSNTLTYLLESFISLVNRILLLMFTETMDKDTYFINCLKFKTHYYNSLLSSEDVLFGVVTLIQSVNLLSLSTIHNTVKYFVHNVQSNFN